MADENASGAAGNGATGGTPGATGGTAPWYGTNIDATDLSHLQNRGWDKLDAPAAAIAAAKAHREAEKLIGGRPEDLLKMPKDASDTEGWTRFNARVGVPADPKEYDFSAVKFSDGTELDAKVTDAIRGALQKAHVSKADAPEVVKALVSVVEGDEKAEAEAQKEALRLEHEKLRINWGSNVEPNLVVARNAANTLKIDPAAVAALEKQIGYAAVMEMFREIGTRIGEDSFVKSTTPGVNTPMTLEQAETELASLNNDTAFYAKLQAGDANARKQFDNLTRLVSAGRAARMGGR